MIWRETCDTSSRSGENDANFYRYVGNGVTYRTDPTCLVQAGIPLNNLFGGYSGNVVSPYQPINPALAGSGNLLANPLGSSTINVLAAAPSLANFHLTAPARPASIGPSPAAVASIFGNAIYDSAANYVTQTARTAINAGAAFVGGSQLGLETSQSRALETEWARQSAAIRAAERTGQHPDYVQLRAMQERVEGPPRNIVEAALRSYAHGQIALTDALTIMDERAQRAQEGARYEMVYGIGSADQAYDLRRDPDRWKYGLLVDAATDPGNVFPGVLLLGESRAAARTGEAFLDVAQSLRQNVRTGGRALASELGRIQLQFDRATLSSGGLGAFRFQLAPGQTLQAGQAGRFADLESLAVVGDKLTPHHMPQAALGFTSRAEGGAIMLPESQHVLTRTYGVKGANLATEEAGVPFRTILSRDIRDIRRIGGREYNAGIQDLFEYYRQNFPELIAKP